MYPPPSIISVPWLLFPSTLLFALTLFCGGLTGQSAPDSLEIAYLEQWNSPEKLATLISLIDRIEETDTDTAQLNQWLIDGEQLASQFPDRVPTLNWYMYRNSLEIRRGNFQLGYVNGLKAIELARQLNDRQTEAKAAYKTAFALSEYDYEASISFYLACIDISREVNDSITLVDCLIDYADAFTYSNQYSDEVLLELLAEARLICELLELGDQRMTNYVHYIIYYIGIGKLEAATAFLTPLRELTDSLARYEDSFYLAIPLEMEALALEAAGQFDAAIPLAERALEIYLESKELANLDGMYQLLLELYESAGRYREGYELMQGYLAYREETFSSDKRLLVSRLNERYQVAEKEALIEDQQFALEEARQRFLMLGGAAMLFGGLLVVVFWQSSRIRRKNAELSVLSSEVVEQNDRLNTLLGELHHRVKNNLQLISSLLRLQARKTTDDSVKSALSVGQRRVEAMSIIHQRLYQQEDITVVNVQSVFEELIQRTDFSYRHQLTPIEMEVSSEPRQLDATLAIPLTLIVNELVTNSCKYAFSKVDRPSIKLSIERLSAKELRLCYADNGPGIPKGVKAGTGFGTQLIESLSGQLGGENRYYTDTNGAHFELVFLGDF
jgi:two-component sensor histidine kinase